MQVYTSLRAQEALRAARAAERVGEAEDYREKDREAEKLLAQILNKPVGVPKAQFYSVPPSQPARRRYWWSVKVP